MKLLKWAIVFLVFSQTCALAEQTGVRDGNIMRPGKDSMNISPATLDDIVDEYGENWQEAEGFDEEYGFRPNGASTEFPGDIGIYCKSHYEMLDSFPARFAEEITYQTEPW